MNNERWENTKSQLVEQSQLEKLTINPNTLISKLTTNLDSRLQNVSNYLEETDNRNIILRDPKGKHIWRLSSGKNKDAAKPIEEE